MATPTSDDVSLIAYGIYPQSEMLLTPAPISRDWMDQTYKRFAYRRYLTAIGRLAPRATHLTAIWRAACD